MSLSTTTDFNEAATTSADFNAQKIVQANSEVLSADTNTLVERALRRTRFLYNGGPFPTGVTITQSTTNGDGLTSAGNGTGKGIVGTGGASNGSGASFTGGASNGMGVEGFGTGTGRGAAFQGGATSGAGVLGQGGGGNAAGVQGQGNGTGPAFESLGGGVKFSATQPAATADPGEHVSHSTNQCKSWALVTTDGAGNVTLVDGYNVASVAIASTVLTVTFARAFAATAYCPTFGDGSTPVSAEANMWLWDRDTSTGSAMKVYGRRVSAGAVANVDLETTVNVILVQVMGRH